MEPTMIPLQKLDEWNALIAEKTGWTVKLADSVKQVLLWPGNVSTYVDAGKSFIVHRTGVELTVPPYFSHIKAATEAESWAMDEGWTVTTSKHTNGCYRVEYSRLDIVDTEFVGEDRNRAWASMVAFCKAVGVEVPTE